MSSEMIVLLIGAVLMIIAILDSFSSLQLINLKLRIPVGIVGFILLMYGGYSYGAINLQGQIEQPDVGRKLQVQYPVEKIQVISPIEGDAVKCRILTMGVYPEGHDKDIWVLLKPSDNRYYPQSDHTNTSYKRNGEWQVITRFGGDKDESYELIVYETDEAASQYFSAIIQSWKSSTNYPGIEQGDIPESAVEVDRIKVTLEESCRGVF